MHFYIHYMQPLFVQALMGIKNIYDTKPIAIHILGILNLLSESSEPKCSFKAALAIFISYRGITVVMVLHQLPADMNKNHIVLDIER